MHKLQMYENLQDMLEQEVKEIERKGDLNLESLDNLYKLMTALKVTDKCIDREKGEQGGQGGMASNNSYGSYGYSGNHYSRNDGMTNDYANRRMPYYAHTMDADYANADMPNGMSNEGMSNARRGRDGDSDGRYNESRDNFRNNQDRGGSHESYDGRSYEYSRDASKKKMIQKLETLMDDTMSEHERKAIMECIEKIK